MVFVGLRQPSTGKSHYNPPGRPPDGAGISVALGVILVFQGILIAGTASTGIQDDEGLLAAA